MSVELLQHQNDGIVSLTLNRPQLHNSISILTLIDALISAFDRINAGKSVKVAILTGTHHPEAVTAFIERSSLPKIFITANNIALTRGLATIGGRST